jgi:hypothetical protein
MALVKGVNSYATVAEADAYFGDRLDADAWTAASDERKAQALVTATSLLDGLSWQSTVVSESQDLAHPRVGEYLDPKLGLYVSMATVVKRVINACFEWALHLLTNVGVLDETGGIDSLGVTGINLTKIRATPRMPETVRSLVRPLLVNLGSRAWWRAN